jgi:two-component system, LytTR family, sensor kinase
MVKFRQALNSRDREAIFAGRSFMAAQAATLINWLGFLTGAALYAMLLLMSLGGARGGALVRPLAGGAGDDRADRLPLVTALLGLTWNVGSLIGFGLRSHAPGGLALALLDAAAFTALGFLPAVVVHSLVRMRQAEPAETAARGGISRLLTGGAYLLSAAAGALHFQEALVDRAAPAHWALHLLALGFCALIAALLLLLPRGGGWRRVIWVAALAWFAVSAQHLSHHGGEGYSWWIEGVGHHASLPFAFVILYQDYRFALADLFLKRALVLLLFIACAFGVYSLALLPLFAARSEAGAGGGQADLMIVGVLLLTWVAAALLYQPLRRAVGRFVDRALLRRADYEVLRAEVAEVIARQETAERLLDELSERVAAALTAREVHWAEAESPAAPSHHALCAVQPGPLLALPGRTKSSHARQRAVASVLIPTVDAPRYQLLVGELSGGRRLLSDDAAFLEFVAMAAARRVDALRVTHERCRRDLREQEIRKLATEAELRALRAQLNPHFLFNALTTVGWLIQSSPARALDTLMRLTSLLRGVLSRAGGEFVTLGEEVDLIEAYLEIERARFEERLRVLIDVPEELRGLRVPALLVQPLVENAVKHGISPQRAGGEVVVVARLAKPDGARPGPPGADDTLELRVRDTGAGAGAAEMRRGRRHGFGLLSVEERLRHHFGAAATFTVRSAPRQGTTAQMSFPVSLPHAARAEAGSDKRGSALTAARG